MAHYYIRLWLIHGIYIQIHPSSKAQQLPYWPKLVLGFHFDVPKINLLWLINYFSLCTCKGTVPTDFTHLTCDVTMPNIELTIIQKLSRFSAKITSYSRFHKIRYICFYISCLSYLLWPWFQNLPKIDPCEIFKGHLGTSKSLGEIQWSLRFLRFHGLPTPAGQGPCALDRGWWWSLVVNKLS